MKLFVTDEEICIRWTCTTIMFGCLDESVKDSSPPPTEERKFIPYRCRWRRRPSERRRCLSTCSTRVRRLPSRRGQRGQQLCVPRCCACPTARFVCRWCRPWRFQSRRRWRFPSRQRVGPRALVHRVPCRAGWNVVRHSCSHWCYLQIRGCGSHASRLSIRWLHQKPWRDPTRTEKKSKCQQKVMQVIDTWLKRGER